MRNNERSKKVFKNILSNCNWDVINTETNIDIVYSKFQDLFSAVYDTARDWNKNKNNNFFKFVVNKKNKKYFKK